MTSPAAVPDDTLRLDGPKSLTLYPEDGGVAVVFNDEDALLLDDAEAVAVRDWLLARFPLTGQP